MCRYLSVATRLSLALSMQRVERDVTLLAQDFLAVRIFTERRDLLQG